ncbi:hypothetical protein QJS66_22465 [Kocuria rhizophila]|nr:hypothetical protein QJS66_22465 [Kocuria rhizophila]
MRLRPGGRKRSPAGARRGLPGAAGAGPTPRRRPTPQHTQLEDGMSTTRSTSSSARGISGIGAARELAGRAAPWPSWRHGPHRRDLDLFRYPGIRSRLGHGHLRLPQPPVTGEPAATGDTILETSEPPPRRPAS